MPILPEERTDGMQSIRSVFKIGNGPSSSHTVGPFNAAGIFKERYPDADTYSVTLYGSLALTGNGHGTANAISAAIPGINIIFDRETKELPHPNTMVFSAEKGGEELGRLTILSIGGGALQIPGEHNPDFDDIYPQRNFSEILEYCKKEGINLVQFVCKYESCDLREHLWNCWQAMKNCIEKGLKEEGILPGGLEVQRKAKTLFNTVSYNESNDITMYRLISSFAYAACEENACSELVVTAPTCGSCGVIPAILYYMEYYKGFPEEEIIDALTVAGLVGNVIRTNASISGAECGCQAEIGSACSMAAAGLAQLYGLNLEQIEYAAEVAMEHNLGLTCDPVNGLVQIPCIERNAVASMRAMDAVNLARFLYSTRKISLDMVIETMYRTGMDMDEKYKETAFGGLATMYENMR